MQRGNAETGSILCRFWVHDALIQAQSVKRKLAFCEGVRCRNKAEHLGIRFYPYPLVYAIGGHAQDSAALNSFWLLDAFAQICPQSVFFKTQNNKAVLS